MQEVKIKPITESSIVIGKKVVYKDENSNWVSVSKLSKLETKAFTRYKIDVLENNISPLPVKVYDIWKPKREKV
ncbi:hypothetical protein [Tenacibaculum sp. M341]|uniref:hypothetical protein n=1 Tax=Tenacibaculum sp. M341 TaxID=2530339 RepID=UPI00104C0424|nr:hypothetical protein [Tenacibaculum sp. M341]TCI93670.1 hypothetical protein EYW44_04450 [Tenacibaculum sp. M341]